MYCLYFQLEVMFDTDLISLFILQSGCQYAQPGALVIVKDDDKKLILYFILYNMNIKKSFKKPLLKNLFKLFFIIYILRL